MRESALCFGRFRLDLARCQLLLDERPLQLGDRALQVLCILAGAKGALVSKDELMARVWAGQVVEENNLQVQISTLRKVLDPDGTGESWIVTVPGRGYRLLGLGDAGSHPDRPPAEPAYHNNLPLLANALIGREHDVAELEALLSRYRLVTLVGGPGVGKTSLSLQVGADLSARFPDGARFVELAPLDRAELVGEAVAAVFGLPVHGERPATDAVAAFLRSRRVLLILDNCEHLIAAAAKLADALLKTCPSVFLLATSRGALSVAGEHAYQVPLLGVPQRSTSLTAAQAMEHSAVQHFVERAAAALGRFSLTDETAAIVAEICRRLDGICSPRGAVWLCPGSRRCARRSNGATPCSRRPSRRCCAGSGSSRAASRWRRWRQSPRAHRWRRRMPSMCLPGWWTSRWWCRSRARTATGCSSQPGRSRWRSWRPATTPNWHVGCAST
jgi:DNA-binding winged helix-turn-helix (wHTH) protein